MFSIASLTLFQLRHLFLGLCCEKNTLSFALFRAYGDMGDFIFNWKSRLFMGNLILAKKILKCTSLTF